jgi:spore coat protein A
MHDPRARIAHGEREHTYENDQRAATLWYHDHRMDVTGAQVWRGLAGFYLIRDEEEDRLPLPRGDREVPLMICDRSFEADGSFRYPSLREGPGVTSEYTGGVLGDVILANGAPWPRMDVANVRYRFRILNASNARRYELALDPMPPGGAAFVQIGSDGGLLESPVSHRSIGIAPAERFDVIIDFSQYRPGASVTLLNRAGAGSCARIMRFDITRSGHDDSAIPPVLSKFTGPDRSEAVIRREFDFGYQRLGCGWTINGKAFDPARMDARPRLGATEIWRLKTDFSHPLHLHLVHFRVLSHSGRPMRSDAGWKDTIDLGPGEAATILATFSGYRGRYVFHCHNLEHEDMGMMANFEVI